MEYEKQVCVALSLAKLEYVPLSKFCFETRELLYFLLEITFVNQSTSTIQFGNTTELTWTGKIKYAENQAYPNQIILFLPKVW